MAMNQGTVDDSGVGSGYTKLLFDAMWAEQDIPPEAKPDAIAAARKSIAGLARACAGIVSYIQGNAEATAHVSSLDAALQLTTTPSNPTAPNPALPPPTVFPAPPGGLPLNQKGRIE